VKAWPLTLSLLGLTTSCVSTPEDTAQQQPKSCEEDCRPFRTGLIKLAPDLDAIKPLGNIDESGWALATQQLIGSMDDKWVGAYDLKKKTFSWWLEANSELTAPAEVFGSWAILPLRDGRLVKVETQTGKKLWETRLSRFVATRMTLSGTTLLAFTTDQKLFAVDFQTGQNLWLFDAGSPANLLLRSAAGPVVAGNEVFVGTSEGQVMSLNLQSGKENWKLDPGGGDARFRDIVGEIGLGNRQIYVARYDGLVFAVDTLQRPSDVLWKETLPSITSAAYRDGILYIGCLNGDVFALQAGSGRQVWKTNLGQTVKSLTIGERALFVGGSQGRVSSLSIGSGALLWHDDVQGLLTRSPVVVDEQIYFATGLKVLYGYRVL
jgi:outer membrane protein assembly factor BamB